MTLYKAWKGVKPRLEHLGFWDAVHRSPSLMMSEENLFQNSIIIATKLRDTDCMIYVSRRFTS